MLRRSQLNKKMDYLWEISASAKAGMRVPAQVYALEEMLDALLKDRSLEQLMNVATLPGICEHAIVMPDAHEGYGFPIGGVAATQWPDGVISPGGIGYDINCGVRMLTTEVQFDDIKDRLSKLAKVLYQHVPSGVGKGGPVKLDNKQMKKVLEKGARWAAENGYGEPADLEYIESGGTLEEADHNPVSQYAKDRGNDQLGTIGGGNHFAEIDKVSHVFNEEIAKSYSLEPGQVVILIHTGSRGLGHQVATDYIRTMLNALPKYNIDLVDRQLACVPFHSQEGQDYFHAMASAANFAWCNREVITWEIRNAWRSLFGSSGGPVNVMYDVAHNIAKIEKYPIQGKEQKMIVHRKGATRAFGPGNPEIPGRYTKAGQPVMIPGSMGTHSYVLAGTNQSYEKTFGSTCHGAGRRLSRRKAKKQVEAIQLVQDLKEQGIFVQAGSKRGVAEEAPVAYKDVDIVVDTVHQAGIAQKVAKLSPLAVIKG